ncbi:CPBP family glutamic-type intramembrane protease [Streptomyces sp. NPDC055056]
MASSQHVNGPQRSSGRSVLAGGVVRAGIVWRFWLVAVALELLLAVAFLLCGADAQIEKALSRAGLGFGTDLVTAARAVAAYWPAALAVGLALAQVAAPDLAVFAVARRAGGRELLRGLGRRLRPWSPRVGARRGLLLWGAVVMVFTAANLVSGLLHRELLGVHFQWHLGWSALALLPVAMFLDAGALFEENGWRGFALPVLLGRYGPVSASLLVGLAWAAWHFPVKYDAFITYGVGGGAAYLSAFTVKIVAMSVVMTFFWARAEQATLLAVAMHGLSNDVARIGGLSDYATWQVAAVSELDLAAPFAVVAACAVWWARRRGWGDLTPLAVADRPAAARAAKAVQE